MNTYKLSNVTPAQFRQFLTHAGCVFVSIEGGHEKWRKDGCLRSVVFQTHISPIPEFVLKNNLRTLGMTRKNFIDWLNSL